MKENLAKLINLKSIVTLVLTLVLCYMAVAGKIDPDKFYTLVLMVLTFYFGVVKEKRDRE